MGGTSARAMRRVAEAKKLQICTSRLIAKLRKKKDSLVGLWNKAFVKTVEFVAISVLRNRIVVLDRVYEKMCACCLFKRCVTFQMAFIVRKSLVLDI